MYLAHISLHTRVCIHNVCVVLPVQTETPRTSTPGNLKAKSKSIINISSRTQHYTRRICIFVPHAIATQSGSVEDHINWLISADAL